MALSSINNSGKLAKQFGDKLLSALSIKLKSLDFILQKVVVTNDLTCLNYLNYNSNICALKKSNTEI